MTQITMCQDNACPGRNVCRRHEASGTRPDPLWQGYGGFSHVRGLMRCPAYLPAPHAPDYLPAADADVPR